MHFPTPVILSFLAAALAGSASAVGCFSSGELGQSREGVDKAHSACNSLAGTYSGGSSKSVCINGSGGIKWDFRITNTFDTPVTVSVQHCIDGMVPTANGCPGGGVTRGGIRATGLVEATIDPNAGAC